MDHDNHQRFDYKQAVYLTIFTVYLLPVLIYSKHSIGLMPSTKSWGILSVGLVLSLFGSALLILLVHNWEVTLKSKLAAIVTRRVDESLHHQSLQMPATGMVYEEEKITPLHPDPNGDHENSRLRQMLAEGQKQSDQLSEELRSTMHELRQFAQEKDTLAQQLEDLRGEYDRYTANSEDKLQQRDGSVSTFQRTLVEQRTELESKQHLIAKLENKVRDLSYEVKTLLQLGDMASTQTQVSSAAPDNVHPVVDGFNQKAEIFDVDTLYETNPTSSDRNVRSPYDASLQLEHCIELAQNLEGAAHLGVGSRRFGDLAVESRALDLRRLADKFRSEVSAPVLLFNPSDNHLMFASNQIQGIVGWSPEKLVKDFYQLLQDGRNEWDHAVSALSQQEQVQVRIVVKTKSGQDVMTYCHLGMIRSGIFTQHVVGVLLPAV
ncbi:Uncharacterized protein SCG7086_CS_00030 [Chlamydiales bacterium SCGC AG-110-P3]|nr:Uncharacterized protein SCG7086_CS_00030 [Chlamydiales bacterium SCGC AG-110-P3]